MAGFQFLHILCSQMVEEWVCMSAPLLLLLLLYTPLNLLNLLLLLLLAVFAANQSPGGGEVYLHESDYK